MSALKSNPSFLNQYNAFSAVFNGLLAKVLGWQNRTSLYWEYQVPVYSISISSKTSHNGAYFTFAFVFLS